MNQFQKFARGLSSLSGAANRLDGGAPSRSRPTAFNHSQRQRSSGTALGLRWGLYRTTCAVGTTGRRSMGGLGSTGRGMTRPGVFLRADGRDCRPFLAIIQSRRQGRFQRFAKGQPRHLSASVAYVQKRRCGVIGSAQKAIGVYQNVDC